MNLNFSIQNRIDQIMVSLHSAFPNVRYYFGQKENSVNKSTNYIDFYLVSETVQQPHISYEQIDGYQYDFCNTRVLTIAARVHGKTIDSTSNIIYGLIAALKLNTGNGTYITIDWISQGLDVGVCRQGELAEVRFEIQLPVPIMESFLVTPEFFEIEDIEFVDTITEDYDGYVLNPNLDVPPYYNIGEIVT